MISIRTKLTALVYAGVIATAAVLGGIGILHLSRITKQNSEHTFDLIASAEKEHLDISMGNLKQSVDIMRDLMITDLSDVERFKNDDAYRASLTREFERLFFLIAYHTKGAVSFYTCYNPELLGNGAQGFLWTKNNRFASFAKADMTDVTAYPEDDMEHVGWYYEPVKNGRATWLKPYANKNIGVYMISYVVPLYASGELLGVVGMDIDFSIIIDEINRLIVYQNGYVYLTDQDGLVIYHRDYDTGTSTYTKSRQMRERSAQLNNGWNVTIAAPEKEIQADRNKLIPMLIVATLLIAAVLIVFCTTLTRKIIQPLLELTAATKKIASGDLNVHITVKSHDEIGILAETFQKTVQHLPEYMYRDSLTGVRNASSYKRTVEKLEERIKAERPLFGICVFDVNNLKQTNDLYGHEVGNQLIINATRLICRIFSHSPVFRIGGDEFVVILENADFNNRAYLLQQFELESQSATFTATGITFPVSVAYGIGVYNILEDTCYSDVFNRADTAMYENKKAYKTHGRVNIHHE